MLQQNLAVVFRISFVLLSPTEFCWSLLFEHLKNRKSQKEKRKEYDEKHARRTDRALQTACLWTEILTSLAGFLLFFAAWIFLKKKRNLISSLLRKPRHLHPLHTHTHTPRSHGTVLQPPHCFSIESSVRYGATVRDATKIIFS